MCINHNVMRQLGHLGVQPARFRKRQQQVVPIKIRSIRCAAQKAARAIRIEARNDDDGDPIEERLDCPVG